jgi:hypothetical protein
MEASVDVGHPTVREFEVHILAVAECRAVTLKKPELRAMANAQRDEIERLCASRR